MTTTAFSINGFRIVKSFGVVRGITVRSRSVFGTIGASLQTIVGGNITLFSELCEQTRAEAFEMMVNHAVERGANAVIGVRYDATLRDRRRRGGRGPLIEFAHVGRGSARRLSAFSQFPGTAAENALG